MKYNQIIVFLAIVLLPSFAFADCVILKDANQQQAFFQKGSCLERETAASTFKIPLAIIAYNQGILKSPDFPVMEYEQGEPDWIEIWKEPQTPTSWIRNSVVWYSQRLTKQLGRSVLEKSLKELGYGNADLSNKNGENGIERAWLNGALQISPKEQSVFLSKLATGLFSYNAQEQEFLKSILKLDETVDGWTIYGKTGATGYNPNPKNGQAYRIAWFVGFMEKEQKQLVFVNFAEQKQANLTVSGAILRKKFEENLSTYLAKYSVK